MSRRFQAALFGGYRRLPEAVRTFLIRRVAPSFHVGAVCLVEREDGSLLLVRQSYRKGGWGLPGGLMRRREEPADAARREVGEELGIDVELVGEPIVVVDSPMRRVDVVFNARLAAGSARPDDTVHSPEISEARWFRPDELPGLLPEAATALQRLGRSLPPR